MSYKVFPDFGPLPPIVDAMLRAGKLVDISYGNDLCPSFILTKDEATVDAEGSSENVAVLFVDYEDPDQREYHNEPRFQVGIQSPHRYVSTNDELEAIRLLYAYSEAETAKLPTGWQEISTGGGCTAWSKDKQGYVTATWLITDGECAYPVEEHAPCLLGLYNDADQVCYWECSCLAQALEIANSAKS
jgi:hypothetical protein